MQLLAEAEARVSADRQLLLESINHYGMLYEVTPQQLDRFTERLLLRGNGRDIVVGSHYGVEFHGGGVLKVLLDFWAPDQRPARLEDSFPFRSSSRPVALSEIYRSHCNQIFLPVPGTSIDKINGQIPRDPQLPRMHFVYPSLQSVRSATDSTATPDVIDETDVDAYPFLGILLAKEPSLDRAWTNRVGQRLTTGLLLRMLANAYLEDLELGDEDADHTHLHMVELLLAFGRRKPDAVDPNAVKRRFLAVELRRDHFGREGPSEALGHYAESLGRLLQHPDVSWTTREKEQVRNWLAKIETSGAFGAATPINHFAHLLSGLRMIERERAKLE